FNAGVLSGTPTQFGTFPFTVTATDAYSECSTSQALTLTVNAAPAFTTQPASQGVTAGNSASFTVAASGLPAPGYRWQVSTDGGTSWTALTDSASYSGTATATLTVTSSPVSLNGTRYRAVAANGIGSATSTAATLTVHGPATLTPATLKFGGTKAGA